MSSSGKLQSALALTSASSYIEYTLTIALYISIYIMITISSEIYSILEIIQNVKLIKIIILGKPII